MAKVIGPAKSGFIAKSGMTFAQYIATAGLATKLFGEFPLAWKIALIACMLVLIVMAIILYPNKNNEEEA